MEFPGNYGKAYAVAYNTDYDAAAAIQLLQANPAILDRIQVLRGAIAEDKLISKFEHASQLAIIRDVAVHLGQPKVAYQAERSRGELAGFYAGMMTSDKKGDGSISVYVNLANGTTKIIGPNQPLQNVEVVEVPAKQVA